MEAKINGLYKILMYALGIFSDKKTKPYDKQVPMVRSFWVLFHIITCLLGHYLLHPSRFRLGDDGTEMSQFSCVR